MKNIFLGFILLYITSCTTSKLALSDGNYAQAVNLAYKKVAKNPNNQKEILNLEQAFAKAQQQDLNEIALLKKEGDPGNWEKIYERYKTIRLRQLKVQGLPQLKVEEENRIVEFNFINVDDELVKSKQNAAAYFYTYAQELLANGSKENARKAYTQFLQVKKYYSNFRSVDSLISVSQAMGTNHVLIRTQNKTTFALPNGFADEMLRINTADLNREWVQFDTRESQNVQYDFLINLTIRQLNLSPERVTQNNYSETKIVADGYDYILDKEGNHKKDSLGNEIKTERTKTVTCNVHETIQMRNAEVLGYVEYVNLNTKQVVKSVDVAGGYVFENHFATVTGNFEAISENTNMLMTNHWLPFPDDEYLFGGCLPVLKEQQITIIRNNIRLVD